MGSDSTTCVERRAALVGPTCSGQKVIFGRYHLGGAVALIGQYHWTEPKGTSGQYYPESKGSQSTPGWTPGLVRT